MNWNFVFIICIIVMILLLGTSTTVEREIFFSEEGSNPVVPAVGVIPERVELEQGWSQATRLDFWFRSQGSQLIPYKWFTWLEQPGSTELFRSADHMEMLRYLPFPSSEENPSGLPIGFTITEAKRGKDQWLGMTCAACHTNQIDFQGNSVLIEGAPTLANFVLFLDLLVASLEATGSDDEKFNRFAQNVLVDRFDRRTAEKLRERLLEITQEVKDRIDVNALPEHYPEDFTSYGRLDAFGNIQNAGSAFGLQDLTNRNPPTAPVSYPFLWGTHQSDVVQWNASAPNTPIIGPLVRNMGEVVGVFGNLKIEKTSWLRRVFGKKHKYSSTMNLGNLGRLEAAIKSLKSPQWPDEFLPSIDEQKSARGAVLYDQHCSECHQVIPRDEEHLKYISVKNTLEELGTDPVMALNAQNLRVKTHILKGRKSDLLIMEEFGDSTRALNISLDGVLGVVESNPGESLKAGLIVEVSNNNPSIKDLVNRHTTMRKEIENTLTASIIGLTSPSDTGDLSTLVYKARPLNGIWATAPYLHNGSVPSLWALLQSPGQRPLKFWVGDREFDPIHVGFNTTSGMNEFKVLNNTGQVQPGNSNAGHVYGIDLTENDKWDLIEYMKSL